MAVAKKINLFTRNKLLFVSALAGLVSFIIGVVFGFVVIPEAFNAQIIEAIRLEPGSEQFNRWKATDQPLQIKFYFFNISNIEDVLHEINPKQPHLQEVGPYIYDLHISKENILFVNSTKTIQYSKRRTYHFNREKTPINLSESDIILTANVPLMIILQLIEGNKFLVGILNNSISHSFPGSDKYFPYEKFRVDDLMFRGYQFCVKIPNIQDPLFCSFISPVLPKNYFGTSSGKYFDFSFYGLKNNTYEGMYEINSGMNNIEQLGSIHYWNKKYLHNTWMDYHRNSCNIVRGGDFLLFKPFNDWMSSFDVFFPNMCRAITLDFSKEIEFKGIPGYRSVIIHDTLEHIMFNECYCIKATKDLYGQGACQPAGFLDLMKCQGIPALASMPHFIWASQSYASTVSGMKPDPDLHLTYVDMEPNTGTMLRRSRRFQLNLILRQINDITLIRNITTPRVMPIFWIDEAAEISDDMADRLKTDYLNYMELVIIMRWILIVVGGIILFLCASYFIMSKRPIEFCILDNTGANMMPNKTRNIVLASISVISGLLFIGFLTVSIVFDGIVDDILNKFIRIETGTDAWDRFVELPVAMEFKIYTFNLTNIEDVLTKGDKPELKQIGPYVFKENRKKRDLFLYEDTVDYREDQFYYFDAEASYPYTEEDTFDTLNVVMMLIYQILEPFEVEIPNLSELIENAYGNKELFERYFFADLLFRGIHFCHPDTTSFESKLLCLLITLLDLKFVEHIPDGSMKLSLFYYKNFTDAGLFNVNRGMKDISNVAEINTWNGMTYTNFWVGDENECDKIHGREGTIFPPNMQKQEYRIYSPDICTTASLSFVTDDSSYEDIPAYEYELNRNLFISENPQESCHCIKGTLGVDGEPNCFMDGVFDLRSCFGVPALLSFPHFLYADDKYKNAVNGLNPNEEEHATTLQIEPVSGAPLSAGKRVQFNFVVRPIPLRDDTIDLPRLVLPVAWIDEGVDLSGDLLDLVKTQLFWLDFMNIARWVLTAIFAVLCIVPGFFAIRAYMQYRKSLKS